MNIELTLPPTIQSLNLILVQMCKHCSPHLLKSVANVFVAVSTKKKKKVTVLPAVPFSFASFCTEKGMPLGYLLILNLNLDISLVLWLKFEWMCQFLFFSCGKICPSPERCVAEDNTKYQCEKAT